MKYFRRLVAPFAAAILAFSTLSVPSFAQAQEAPAAVATDTATTETNADPAEPEAAPEGTSETETTPEKQCKFIIQAKKWEPQDRVAGLYATLVNDGEYYYLGSGERREISVPSCSLYRDYVSVSAGSDFMGIITPHASDDVSNYRFSTKPNLEDNEVDLTLDLARYATVNVNTAVYSGFRLVSLTHPEASIFRSGSDGFKFPQGEAWLTLENTYDYFDGSNSVIMAQKQVNVLPGQSAFDISPLPSGTVTFNGEVFGTSPTFIFTPEDPSLPTQRLTPGLYGGMGHALTLPIGKYSVSIENEEQYQADYPHQIEILENYPLYFKFTSNKQYDRRFKILTRDDQPQQLDLMAHGMQYDFQVEDAKLFKTVAANQVFTIHFDKDTPRRFGIRNTPITFDAGGESNKVTTIDLRQLNSVTFNPVQDDSYAADSAVRISTVNTSYGSSKPVVLTKDNPVAWLQTGEYTVSYSPTKQLFSGGAYLQYDGPTQILVPQRGATQYSFSAKPVVDTRWVANRDDSGKPLTYRVTKVDDPSINKTITPGPDTYENKLTLEFGEYEVTVPDLPDPERFTPKRITVADTYSYYDRFDFPLDSEQPVKFTAAAGNQYQGQVHFKLTDGFKTFELVSGGDPVVLPSGLYHVEIVDAPEDYPVHIFEDTVSVLNNIHQVLDLKYKLIKSLPVNFSVVGQDQNLSIPMIIKKGDQVVQEFTYTGGNKTISLAPGDYNISGSGGYAASIPVTSFTVPQSEEPVTVQLNREPFTVVTPVALGSHDKSAPVTITFESYGGKFTWKTGDQPLVLPQGFYTVTLNTVAGYQPYLEQDTLDSSYGQVGDVQVVKYAQQRLREVKVKIDRNGVPGPISYRVNDQDMFTIAAGQDEYTLTTTAQRIVLTPQEGQAYSSLLPRVDQVITEDNTEIKLTVPEYSAVKLQAENLQSNQYAPEVILTNQQDKHASYLISPYGLTYIPVGLYDATVRSPRLESEISNYPLVFEAKPGEQAFTYKVTTKRNVRLVVDRGGYTGDVPLTLTDISGNEQVKTVPKGVNSLQFSVAYGTYYITAGDQTVVDRVIPTSVDINEQNDEMSVHLQPVMPVMIQVVGNTLSAGRQANLDELLLIFTNKETNQQIEVRGTEALPELPVGTYTVTVARQPAGFAVRTVSTLEVTSEQNAASMTINIDPQALPADNGGTGTENNNSGQPQPDQPKDDEGSKDSGTGTDQTRDDESQPGDTDNEAPVTTQPKDDEGSKDSGTVTDQPKTDQPAAEQQPAQPAEGSSGGMSPFMIILIVIISLIMGAAGGAAVSMMPK